MFFFAIATKTRMYCWWCRQLQLMKPVDGRIWGFWRCHHCDKERPLRMPVRHDLDFLTRSLDQGYPRRHAHGEPRQ
jgi:hypothetical protein